jgi:hypothetical protein
VYLPDEKSAWAGGAAICRVLLMDRFDWQPGKANAITWII